MSNASASSSSPSPPRPWLSIIQTRIREEGWKTIILFHLTLIPSIALYVFDIGSDILLANKYFNEGNTGWGGSTTAFIALAWILQLIFSFYRWVKNRNKTSLFYLIFAIFNLFPIALLLNAVKQFWEDGSSDAKQTKARSQNRTTEICCESTPQAALQLYIASQQNHLDVILIISIVTSLISVVLGITKGFSNINATGNTLFKDKETLLTLILSPWIFLCTLCFVPTVSFFSSLRNHASPSYMSFLAYFFIHLLMFWVLFCTSDWKKNGQLAKSTKILLPLFFSLTAICFSTCWIVSLAPFLPDASLRLLPDFIQSDPFPPFDRWVVKNATFFNETWAHCNRSSTSNSSSSSYELCMTDRFMSSSF